MVFSSITFVFFFLPIVLVVYYVVEWLKKREGNNGIQNAILIFASILFYAWGEPVHVLLMIASIAINYFVGRIIGSTKKHWKWIPLAIGVFYNLGMIFLFKYQGFFAETVNMLHLGTLKNLNLVLPIGISFYTFQSISYLVDVYWAKVEPAKKIQEVALYISFFPQLIAGPIVQYSDICEEIRNRKCNSKLFEEGIYDFIIGFAKKILIFNTVATISEQIMSSDYQYLGCGVAWLGAFCYMLHIYYDFSGYSEMAIGLGKMFGFHLPQNFNFPYMAGNITEFWRRWHITLSSFFRNYVYIPMGGSRKGNVYVHLIIVFLLTGIWHGANWTFIVWGMWHGLFIVIERKFKEKGHLKSNILTWTYTMLVVLVGWVMFSAESVTTGFSYLKIMFGLVKNEFTLFGIGYYMTVAKIWAVILAVIGCAPVVKNFFEKKIIYKFPNVYRGIMFLLFGIAIIELMTNSYNPFIYFQF